MGKDLKGKELGKGISQRADGRYIARFTSKTGKRKTLYDFKLNELKRKLREAVYEDEHGLNGNGESITLNAWYVTWTELYSCLLYTSPQPGRGSCSLSEQFPDYGAVPEGTCFCKRRKI